MLRGAGRSLGAIRALGRARGLAILGVMALVCLPALARLKTDDDIRLLQSSNAALLGEEAEVRAVVGGGDFSRFIVVEGETEEEVLERELAVRELLDALVGREEIGAYFAVSASVPPVSQQRRDARKLATALSSNRRSVDAYFMEIGFSERASSGMWSALGAPEPSALKVRAWLESPASFAQRDLWIGETSRGVASVIMLQDVRDEASLEAIEGSNVSYVNKVADISRLLRLYRTKAAGLAGFAYLAIFLFLVVRYGVRLGICASVPSVMAALSVFGVFGYLEFPLNIFHMLGLLLVLGISVDYAIFLAESREAPNATLLAVTLSGITTLLSFGLLAWSETPFLHGFGSAVLIGVCVAFLTAPLAVLAVGRP